MLLKAAQIPKGFRSHKLKPKFPFSIQTKTGKISVKNLELVSKSNMLSNPFTVRSFSTIKDPFQGKDEVFPVKVEKSEEKRMKELYQEKKYRECEEFFTELKESGTPLTPLLYTYQFKALSNRGALANMFRLLDEYKESCSREVRSGIHFAFLLAFINRGFVGRTINYWKEIGDNLKTPRMFSVAINFFAEKRITGMVLDLLAEAKQRNFKVAPYVYPQVIKALGKRKQYQELLSFVERAKKEGVSANLGFYSYLLKSLSKSKDLENFNKYYNEMTAAKIEPEIVACNAVVGIHSSRGDIENALKAVDDLKNRGFTPNQQTHLNLMMGYFNKGDIDGVIRQFEDMKKQGIEPSTYEYNKLLGYLQNAKHSLFDYYLDEMGHSDVTMNKSTKVIKSKKG